MTVAYSDSHQTLWFLHGGTGQALGCWVHRELAWLFHEPHSGLEDCLDMLLICFRNRMPGCYTLQQTWIIRHTTIAIDSLVRHLTSVILSEDYCTTKKYYLGEAMRARSTGCLSFRISQVKHFMFQRNQNLCDACRFQNSVNSPVYVDFFEPRLQKVSQNLNLREYTLPESRFIQRAWHCPSVFFIIQTS